MSDKALQGRFIGHTHLPRNQALSFLQFIAGLGLGSASLVRHFSGWTLTSISGFSSAFSKVLRRALSAQGNQRYVTTLMTSYACSIVLGNHSLLTIVSIFRPATLRWLEVLAMEVSQQITAQACSENVDVMHSIKLLCVIASQMQSRYTC